MLDLIERAGSEIILSTFGIDSHHLVTQSLLRALGNRKRVRILARPRPSKTTMTALLSLAKAGAEVRGHQWLHAKSLVIDHNGSWDGIIMTSNVEERGLDEGFESGILLQDDDGRQLHDVLEAWWKELPLKLSLSTKLGEVEGPVQVWLEDRSLRVSIERQGQIDLGEIEARSLEDVQKAASVSFRPRFLPRDTTLYHKVLYTWRVPPPRPLKGAKEGN